MLFSIFSQSIASIVVMVAVGVILDRILGTRDKE
jgi:F0F1-type ATP synthase assembly protein I